MKSIIEYINENAQLINEENLNKIDCAGLENALITAFNEFGSKVIVKVADLTLPASYFTSGLVGTIIEFVIVRELKRTATGDVKNILNKFTLDETTEDAIVYGHPDLKYDNMFVEIKANRNLAKDGIVYTKTQAQKFTNYTPIIWVGYSVKNDSIEIDDIKVRCYGDVKGRPYSIPELEDCKYSV